MHSELPPGVYNAIQALINRNYESVGSRIKEMQAEYPGRALEIGCGTGILSSFFAPGAYAGVELDERRVELAKRLHPEHEFLAADATALDPQWVAGFSFLFCHACLHHIEDAGVNSLLRVVDRASAIAGKPIRFLVMEPLLPEDTKTDLPGYIICKLDRGKYMRTLSRLKTFFGQQIGKLETARGPWYWPVPGVSCILQFQPKAMSAAAAG